MWNNACQKDDIYIIYLLGLPSTDLYFTLNGHMYVSGDSVLVSDIGPQPADRSNPGSTLICITTNINTICCRRGDNNGQTNDTAGAVGEWLYPNGTLVPRGDKVSELGRFGYTHQVRLARASSSTPPLGVYTCIVPEPSTGVLHNASVTILHKASVTIDMGML